MLFFPRLQIVSPSLFFACVLEGGGGGRRDGAGQSAWKGYLERGVCGCAWKCGSGSSSLDSALPLAFVIVFFLQVHPLFQFPSLMLHHIHSSGEDDLLEQIFLSTMRKEVYWVGKGVLLSMSSIDGERQTMFWIP